MKRLFAALCALGIGVFSFGCVAPVDSSSEDVGNAEQAVMVYNDPTAVVDAVNDGASYCGGHLCYGGDKWIHLDSGVFTLTDSPDLGITRAVRNQLVGAEVMEDGEIHTAADMYWQAVQSGSNFYLADP